MVRTLATCKINTNTQQRNTGKRMRRAHTTLRSIGSLRRRGVLFQQASCPAPTHSQTRPVDGVSNVAPIVRWLASCKINSRGRKNETHTPHQSIDRFTSSHPWCFPNKPVASSQHTHRRLQSMESPTLPKSFDGWPPVESTPTRSKETQANE